MIKKIAAIITLGVLAGCAVNTTRTDAPGAAIKATSPTGRIGTYSMYGKGIQFDEGEQLHYVTIYVGGGGNDAGSRDYAKNDIELFAKTNGFASYEIVKSEYSFFPLSKYVLYIKFSK